MCMQSVSLWAEATWYRLGGSRTDEADAVVAEPDTSSAPESVAPAVRVEEADERVLVSR